jgi:wobble nucleotide-excising tRNase
MLKKVISIKNVGNFVDYQCSGQSTSNLSKMALIYAENGKGKTTLSAILRSLGTNRTEYILGRRSLGISDTEDVVVSILTDEGAVNFNSTQSPEWNKSVKNIEIFDSIFVNENVFSGDYIDIEHRRKLYRFVVGEESVERAKKIDDIAQKITDLNPKIRLQEADVKNLIKGEMDISVFMNLPENVQAEKQLEKKEKELRDYSEAKEIKTRASFNLICLPEVEVAQIKAELSLTIDSVSSTAERQTLEHLQKYSIPDGENWIRNGIKCIHDETCTLCGQSIQSVDIIRAFREYFNQNYITLKKEIGEAKEKYDSVFAETMLRKIQKDISNNNIAFEFWKDFLQFTEIPVLDTGLLQITWDNIKNELTSCFDRKSQRPIENVEFSESESFEKYAQLVDLIEKYNIAVTKENRQISDLKDKIAQTDEDALKTEIINLQNQIMRYAPAGISECTKYQVLLEDKKKLEEEKKDERDALTAETNLTFSKYQSRINFHLEQIGVNFRIRKTKPSFQGGKANSSFLIEIDGCAIALGGQGINKPGFKNTLSDGDKNTLAFALFLAKLEHDADLENKVVVFDDPVNSLDRYRKSYTIEQIRNTSKTTKQVIVLSHDAYFLRDLWDKFERVNTATLCIRRAGKSSQIETWNIENETDTGYILNYRELFEYLEDGDSSNAQMRSIARCIRPALEGYFRMKYPLDFGIKEWLGNFIQKVRNSSEGDRLFPMKDTIDEIEKISQYSSKYHHKQNLNHDTEPIDDIEMQGYIKRTFKIIHQ